MKDEIKEIVVDNGELIVRYKDNSFECFDTLPKNVLDYITNLQEIEKEHKNCTRKHWQQKCAEHCANEMIYKSRNEKAIEFMKENCDIITLNNGWIIRSELTTTGLGKLFKILNGGDDNE